MFLTKMPLHTGLLGEGVEWGGFKYYRELKNLNDPEIGQGSNKWIYLKSSTLTNIFISE